ncbi:polysaccharide deacetylase family protein [Yinghuangia seranimata]|uniref:polysaccharide deacetylase family protein n=1 Tax=Yinghuangia seranimata TaxID=408067 RepID=UPI00248B7D28|nr:polysaccharide deacetylase family protein [Yinghuangia seranimata]MDI2124656.1 polysaccharide deacetylase family protein [Yinghuangia seranimata]
MTRPPRRIRLTSGLRVLTGAAALTIGVAACGVGGSAGRDVAAGAHAAPAPLPSQRSQEPPASPSTQPTQPSTSPTPSASSGSPTPSGTPSTSGSRTPSGTPSAPGTARGTAPAPPHSSNARPGIPDQASAPPLIRRADAPGRTVALTFDDGPSAQWTPQILEVLDQYGAKAVFCQIGPNATANPRMVKRVVADGHRLCDHSITHDEGMAKRPQAQIQHEVDGARQQIAAVAPPGTPVHWYRAPGGGWSSQIRQTVAASGMRSLDWSVDTRDWEKPGVDAIVANVKRELRPGGVILMHDGGGDRAQTVAALKEILPWLVQEGYTFTFPAS